MKRFVKEEQLGEIAEQINYFNEKIYYNQSMLGLTYNEAEIEKLVEEIDQFKIVLKSLELEYKELKKTLGGEQSEPPKIRFQDMDAYCNKIGKLPSELTEEEIKQFRF